jgi:hypothetical protein
VWTVRHQCAGCRTQSSTWRNRYFPGRALQQIVSANGFTSESDYDSDNLPKGPIAEGGGEADTPRHCEGCGQFLANPLTGHGLIWVEDAIRECLTTRKATAATTDAVNEWADFYKDELDFHRIVVEALERVAARS